LTEDDITELARKAGRACKRRKPIFGIAASR